MDTQCGWACRHPFGRDGTSGGGFQCHVRGTEGTHDCDGEKVGQFRLDRDLHNHVAFGMGIHYCLGAPLARAEARVSLNVFLDRFSKMKPGRGTAVRQTRTPQVFGFEWLPLVLETEV